MIPSHAVIVGATVVVARPELQMRCVTVTTNKQGDYAVSDLTPGDYDVLVTMPNFKEEEQPTFSLQTGQVSAAQFDVTLQVGSVNEKVTVTTEIGALNTDTSSKGDVISPVEISEMPFNGRDFNDLVFNVSRACSSLRRRFQGVQSSSPTVCTRSDTTNIVVVDGINNTSRPSDSTAEATPPLDALQEFKVQTSNYSAEFGRVAGPVINLTIKKGGNARPRVSI